MNEKIKNFKNIKTPKLIKLKDQEKCIEVDFSGKVISSDIDPEYVCFRNHIIGKLKKKEDSNIEIGETQIVSEENKKIKILKQDKWIDSIGVKKKMALKHFHGIINK